MSVLGSGSVHLSGRYRVYGQSSKKDSEDQLCQKCLKKGHWTYECKSERAYVSRPSRTQQLKNPKLRQKLLDPKELPGGINSTNAEKNNRKKEKNQKNKLEEESSASSTSTSRGDSSSSFCSSSPGTTASVKSSVTTSSTSSTDSKNDSVSSNSEAESSDSSLKLSKKNLQNVVQRLEKLKRKRENEDQEVLQSKNNNNNNNKKSKIQQEKHQKQKNKQKHNEFQSVQKDTLLSLQKESQNINNKDKDFVQRDFLSVREESLNNKEIIQKDLQSVHIENKQRDFQSVHKQNNKQEDFQSVQKARQILQIDVQSVQKEDLDQIQKIRKYSDRDHGSVQNPPKIFKGERKFHRDEEIESPAHKIPKLSRICQNQDVEKGKSLQGEKEFSGVQISYNNDISQIGLLQRTGLPQSDDRWQLEVVESLQDENQLGDNIQVEKHESYASGPSVMKSIAVSSVQL